MTKLEQEAIEFMKKHPKDPESQHTETDLERQLAICEQNGTKWAHFKVADIRKLLAPVSGNGPEPRVSLASVTDYDTLFKCPACSSCLRLIGNRVLVDDCNGAQPTPKVEEK